jgi:glycosyltransferase involved in cell wall biosynthesis
MERMSTKTAIENAFALIVPTLNSARTIGDCIESLLRQDALDRLAFVLIADGGSSDGTVDVARRMWTAEVPLEVRSTPPGRGEARDVTDAILSLPPEIEWVFLMHSDNVAKPNWLSEIMACVENADESVASVCSSYSSLYDDGRIEGGEDLPDVPARAIAGDKAVADTLLAGCWWHHATAATRVSVIREFGGYNPEFRQYLDWDLLLRILSNGHAVIYLPRVLMLYRQHAASLSSKQIAKHIDIAESMVIFDRYGGALDRRQRVTFLTARLRSAVVRSATSLKRMQGARLLGAVSALFTVGRRFSKI